MNRELLQKTYDTCLKKFDIHMRCYTEAKEYWACAKGDYYLEANTSELKHMYNWMTSFITGLAPLYYKSEKDDQLLAWAEQFKDVYREKIFECSMETMHDIGFLYSPYCVEMYKQTGDIQYRECAIKAADELIKRFDINGRHINAWDRMDEKREESRAIIDCMMNIALLFWAWKETGHTMYYDVAIAHADTTLKYFIREDGSVAHSFMFDKVTGKMTYECNDCGYENGSHWARGSAWAVYGFAIAFRYTGLMKYCEAAVKVAKKYIEHTEGFIPVWDFRLPKDKPALKCPSFCENSPIWDETDINNKEYNIDTSAAVVFAAGLYEIIKLHPMEEFEQFMMKSVEAVCEEYINTDLDIPGILQRQNGNMSYTTFGDFFLVEVLQRIIYDTPTCW